MSRKRAIIFTLLLLLLAGGYFAINRIQTGRGDVLARLDETTLPQAIILAQAELVAARRALDDLRNSRLQQAQALQALERAEQALEDARDPVLQQAQAQAAIAAAQKALDEAQRTYEIVTRPVSQEAISQARANLLLAENVYAQTRQNYERLERKANKDPDTYMFFESRQLYRRILDNLRIKLVADQRRYEDALHRYNNLLKPVDPNDVLVAEANLAKAKAQLRQAQREWERLKDGPSPAEIAVLEAQLRDAQRNWERLKDGQDEGDLAAAEARLAAVQAAIDSALISAPFSGVVTEVNIQPGDQVGVGQKAFRLDDLDHLLVDAQVSEIDINKLRPGLGVWITLDAAPEKVYSGIVKEVSVVGEVVGGAVVFNVVVELVEVDARVRPGMTASLEIVVEELTDVVLIPNRAIRIMDGQRVVYVQREGKPKAVKVTLGAASQAFSQVLESELQEGELIFLDPPDAFLAVRP